jgi:hypothetical protein
MSAQSTKPPFQGGTTDPRPGSSQPQRSSSSTGTGNPAPRGGSSASDAPLQPVLKDAAATARSVAEDVKESARDVVSDARRASADLTSDLKQAAQSAQRAAKEQASAFAADVGHELNQSAEEQKVRGVEAIQGFARAMTSAAGELEGQSPMVARYVRDAAQQVETLSGNLRGRSVTELMQAASDVARSQPLVFLAGAVASGFALSRFLKSSASRNGGSQGVAGAHAASTGASQEGITGRTQPGTTPGGDFNYGRH